MSQPYVGYPDWRAFRWRAGSFEVLPGPRGGIARAEAVNDRGEVVGMAEAPPADYRATRWRGTTPDDLGTLGAGDRSIAHDINNAGLIVGDADEVAVPYLGSRQRAVLWRNGQIQPLGGLGDRYSSALAVNDAGTIAGWSWVSNSRPRAVVWDPGSGMPRQLPSLEPEQDCEAHDINSSGTVAGTCGGRAVVWHAGQVRDLGPGTAQAINDAGQVLLHVGDPAIDGRAVLWGEGGFIPIGEATAGERWVVRTATALSDGGLVVGSATRTDLVDVRGFLAEPAAVTGSDTTAPTTVAGTEPPANPSGWHNTDVTVHLTATDQGGSGVREIRHTRGGATPGATAGVPVHDPGRTTVSYQAVDNSGNVEEPAGNIEVRIDRSAPVVHVQPATAPNPAGWYRSPVRVHLSARDDGGSGVDHLRYRTEGAETRAEVSTAAADSELQISTDGTTKVTAWAVDKAGNRGAARHITIRLDTRPPRIDIVNPGPTPLDQVTRIAWTAVDDMSGIAERYADIDGRRIPVAPGQPAGPPGRHRLQAAVTDQAGNRATASREYEVSDMTPVTLFPDLADNRRPIARVTASTEHTISGAPVRVNGSDSTDPEGAQLRFRWDSPDGIPRTDPTATYTFHRPGRYLVGLTVNDGSDDSVPTPDSLVLITVDPPPVLRLTVTVSPPSYRAAGQELIFEYRVTNAGPGTLSNPISIADARLGAITACEPTKPIRPHESVRCTAACTTTRADRTARSLTTTSTATSLVDEREIRSNTVTTKVPDP